MNIMQDSLNSLKVEADDTSPKALKWYQCYCQENGCFPSNKKTKRQKAPLVQKARTRTHPGCLTCQTFHKTSLEEGGDTVKVYQLFCVSSAGQLSFNFHKCLNDFSFCLPEHPFLRRLQPDMTENIKVVKGSYRWTE